MTQASVSELVARLERELGVTLFTRGSRRLVPTAAALELRPHAAQAVSAVQNGIDTIQALASLERGTCTFGVLRNAAYYALADLAETFHHRHPNVRLRLVGINSAHVARSIASGELEAGLLVLPVDEDGLEVRPLFRDEVLYASATRPVDAGPVTIDEVASAKLVLYDAFAGWDDPTRRQLLERARLRGLSIEPAVEVENVDHDVHHAIGRPVPRRGRHLDAIYLAPRVTALDGRVQVSEPASSDHLGLVCTVRIG